MEPAIGKGVCMREALIVGALVLGSLVACGEPVLTTPSVSRGSCHQSDGASSVSVGGGASTITWQSPPVLIAAGRHGGKRWQLCARSAVVTERDSERDIPVPSSRPTAMRALCMDWTVPPGGTGMDCAYGGVDPSSPDY